jgi:Kef-type K+ transport system membrane component KefB
MEAFYHLALIWASVLLASWLAEKSRLTPVPWYLFMGALLVNLGWLPEKPEELIKGLSELGIIVIMFALGFEENTNRFLTAIKRSWGIALFGAVAPFTTAWALALFFWGDQNIALMCGLAMTATAVSLTLVSLRDEHLQRTPAAVAIMSSAVLDDIGALTLVAVLVPLVTGSGQTGILDIAWILLKCLAFFGIVVLVSLYILPHHIKTGLVRFVPFLRRYGLWHLVHIGKGTQATLVMVLTALLMALLGHAMGFHPAVGAYMAGLVIKEEYFTRPDRPSLADYGLTKTVIDEVAFIWIGPIFFVTLGSNLLFKLEIFNAIIIPALLLFIALAVAQVASAGLAARYTGRFDRRSSLLIGLGMLGRAELAFVVMGIAYVQHPILSTEAFYTLMLTAMLLNFTVPLAIHWWKSRHMGTGSLR